jgi:hypothetical protein
MNAFMVGQQHVVIITATVTTAAEGHIDLILYVVYCGSTPRRPLLHHSLQKLICCRTASALHIRIKQRLFVFGGASAAGMRDE